MSAHNLSQPSPRATQPSSSGVAALAIASLTLGILGLLTSLFGVGILFALPGLILGILHLRRREDGRRMAWTGVGTSVVGLLIAGVVLAVVISNVRYYSQMSREFRTQPFSEWIGKPAPDLELGTLDGDVIRISDLQGKRVMLDFCATWTREMKSEIPHLIRLRQETSPDEFVMIGISGEDPGVVRSFADQHGLQHPFVCVSRRSLPPPYSEIERLPTKFHIDRNGIIQHVSVGFRGFDSTMRHATAPDYTATPTRAK
jgi:peroxiredoxin